MTKNKLSSPFIIPLLLFVFFFLFYLSIYKKIPIRYWDEHGWIGRSYFFDLFIRGDFQNPLWRTYQGYNTNPLGFYIFGASLYPSYWSYKKDHPKIDYITFLIDHNFYDISSDEYFMKKQNSNFIDWGFYPEKVFDIKESALIREYGPEIQKTIRLIYTIRVVNAFILTLSIVLLYYLILQITKLRLVAVGTSVLYGMNYMIVTKGLLAQAETLFITLFILSILLSIETLIRISSPSKKWLISLRTGLTIGLLTVTKHNGLMQLISLDFILVFLLFYYRKDIQKMRSTFFVFTLTNVSFLVIFYLLQPFLYPSPLNNLVKSYRERNYESQQQTQVNPEYVLSNPVERIGAIYSHYIVDRTQYCHYSSVPLRHYHRCSNILFYSINFITTVGGLWWFINRTIKNKDKKRLLFLYFFISTQIMMSFYLILDWDRYFLHLTPFFTFFMMYGMYQIYLYIRPKLEEFKNLLLSQV